MPLEEKAGYILAKAKLLVLGHILIFMTGIPERHLMSSGDLL
jgi:hypothetical protein